MRLREGSRAWRRETKGDVSVCSPGRSNPSLDRVFCGKERLATR